MTRHQKNVWSNWTRFLFQISLLNCCAWCLPPILFFCLLLNLACAVGFGIWHFESFFDATYHLHLYNVSSCQQEITLLSQLSHPNIVQYYGSELVWSSCLDSIVWKTLNSMHLFTCYYRYSCPGHNSSECETKSMGISLVFLLSGWRNTVSILGICLWWLHPQTTSRIWTL